PVALDPGESQPCVQADLFQSDTRAGPLDVVLEPIEGGYVARIRSSMVVEEPVITVYVRSGCSQQVTRAYVLLAEQPQDLATPALTLAPSPSLALVPRVSDLQPVQPP